MTTGTWVADAACQGHDPELWFSGEYGQGRTPEQEQAMRICRACPVVEECFWEAHRHEAEARHAWGIWAGLTPRQRRQLQRARAA